MTKGGRLIYDIGKPYVPERDYKRNDYKPIGQETTHFCTRCKEYYADLYQSGITTKPFPPKCQGDISQKVHNALEVIPDLTEEEKEDLLYEDPVYFCIAEFNQVPRFYQEEMISCSALRKISRAGRRIGKTWIMAVKILHLLATRPNFSVLVICPYQSQVKRIFDIMRNDLIANSVTLKDRIIKNNTSAPQVITLDNNSTVTGFSSGAKSGGKSTQVRGQDAHAIFLDEMDYLSPEDFDALLAILASHPDCLLWASSTPTGARSQFFDWSIRKDLGFKEQWYISSESPSWTIETEELFKDKYSESAYAREFLAEFGDETAGVFKNSDINLSLHPYTYQSCSYSANCRYIAGVDWNENAGVHIVIIEIGLKDRKYYYKVVYKDIIPRQEFTQTTAVQAIIKLDSKWNLDYIYMDAGFGNVQYEMLKKYGLETPGSKLHKKTRSYQMGGKVEIRDPVNGLKVKKDAKPFMVNVAARQLEAGRCILPISEDTNATLEEASDQVGIAQQMRNFKVEKYSKFGMPTYSQGFEHTLTAWMLALTGAFLEFSDVLKILSDLRVMPVSPLGHGDPSAPQKPVDKEAIIKRKKELKTKFSPTARRLAPSGLSGNNSSLRSMIERDKFSKKAQENIYRLGKIYPGKPGKRKTF